ncbi:MucBP domain-containing protein, partial [Peptostreptococcus porci]|uniref:MucBP domain-containing protein n=1 Tax=Peptostreptococcus porci TaxID=2652282 RepID=UPI002A80270C
MRNNRFKTSESKQRFSIRKCNVGVVSVLLGLSFAFIAGNQVASADEVANTEAPAAIVEKAPEESAATAAEPEASVAAPETSTAEAKPETTATPETATTASAPEATAEPKAATGETAPAAEATATAPTNAEKSGEWKENETVTNKEKAEATATVTPTNEPVKEGYELTKEKDFKTFLILSLSGDQDPQDASQKDSGSFNYRFDKDWYIRFSTDTVTDSGKVLAELVDKKENNTVIEKKELIPAERPNPVAFDKIKEVVAGSNIAANKNFKYDMKNREFNFTDKDGNTSTLRNLEVESGVGGSGRSTVIYSPLTPEKEGTYINDITGVIPINSLDQVTRYILQGTKYKDEKELASYTQSGASGDLFAVSGPADFDKYELISEPENFDGILSPNYLKDSYVLKSYPNQSQAKVQLISKDDGTSKFMTFVINPDHKDVKNYIGKTNLTADDLKLNDIIDIINSTSLTNEEKTKKIQELDSPFLLMYVSKDIDPKKPSEGADILTGKKEWTFTSKHLWKPIKNNTDPADIQLNISNDISGSLKAVDEKMPEALWSIRQFELVNEKGEPIDFDGNVLTDGKSIKIGGMENGLVNAFSPGTEDKKFYYAEKGGVIVHFIDEKGNEISASKTLVDHGATDSEFDTSTVKEDKIVAPDGTVYFLRENSPIDEIGGIKLPSDPKSVGDRFTAETIDEKGKVVRDTVLELTYVYVKAGGVNVHYVNEEGEVIQDPVVDEKDVKPGTEYNTEDKRDKTITTKDGKTYEYKEVKEGSDPEGGNVESGKNKEVTYVYREVKGDVIVKYFDEEGNPLEGVDENNKEVPNTVTDTPSTSTGTEYNTTDNKPKTITTKDGKTYE